MAQAGAEVGAGAGNAAAAWPAAVVHVNEDGWVLLNRGATQGVAPGMRLLVVGDEARELYDTASLTTVGTSTGPRALIRIRRTYELLEVVYAEEQCAVAIAARVPRERRPQVYHAPGGELLVWVPLPPDYTWPGSDAGDEAVGEVEGAGEDTEDERGVEEGAEDVDGAADENQPEANGTQDAESLAEEQEDERWEQALPLNGIHVGDLVLPAVPVPSGGAASPHTTTSADPAPPDSAPSAPVEQQDTPFDSGRDYDWLKPST